MYVYEKKRMHPNLFKKECQQTFHQIQSLWCTELCSITRNTHYICPKPTTAGITQYTSNCFSLLFCWLLLLWSWVPSHNIHCCWGAGLEQPWAALSSKSLAVGWQGLYCNTSHARVQSPVSVGESNICLRHREQNCVPAMEEDLWACTQL